MRRQSAIVAAWVLIALPAWFALFTHDHAQLVVAGHDAVVTPTLDHYARVTMGPYLPDLRQRTESRIGVRVDLGKTTARTDQELIDRYSLIATHPQAEIHQVSDEVRSQALITGLQAGVLAAIPIGAWFLLGASRRTEVFRPTRKRLVLTTAGTSIVLVVVLAPWQLESARVQPTDWIPLAEAIPELTVPVELSGVEVQGGLLTQGTRRLIASAFQGFDEGKQFYRRLADAAPAAAAKLRKPAEGQTAALLISDRHDNIGMDDVARAVGAGVGASAVIDAGDDTSTGEPWEAFSLDSLDEAFEGFGDRITVAGNHDNGTFVSEYLAGHGWTHLAGTTSERFGVRFFGVDDPRSSGLGIWKDEKGLTFDEVGTRVTDELCARDLDGQRVSTLVVHDAKLGEGALARGCVDLVLAGHLHVQVGPTRVVGSNGSIGYSYTNGTTGGAAYALAVGSKLRREAELSVVTFENGRPVGIQPVRINTRGEFLVDPFVPLAVG